MRAALRTSLVTALLSIGLLIASPASAAATHTGTGGSGSGTTTTSTGYNGAAAAAYADTYWSSYNRSYPSFANSGGDCTNFVSQALYNGGILQRSGPAYSGDAAWYMYKTGRNAWAWSTTWINAQHNNNFILGSLAGATVVATYVGVAPGQTVPSNASQGDIVLYDWTNNGVYDHEAIIATADGQTVDAHTNNRYHAYWTLAQYNSSWATTRIVVLHIPPTAS